MRAMISFLLLVAAGCSREAAPEFAQPGHVEPEGPDPVEPAVCAGRPSCRLEAQLMLDRGPEGRELLAVVARLQPHEISHADHIIADREIVLGGPNLCTPFETSLVSRSGRNAERLQTLVTDCLVDTNPAPPVVEKRADGVLRYRISSRLQTADPSRRQQSMYGASEVTDFALDPPRILRTTHRQDADRDPGEDRETTWDWQSFRGQDCWPNAGGCATILPFVEIPGGGTASGGTAAFKAGGWKTTSLGDCAMLVQGSTASLRILAMDDFFTIVEITDDHFVTDGAVVDALEVQVIPEGLMPGGHILHQRLTMDGRLNDDLGRKRRVEVVEVSPTTRRFALPGTWPPDSPFWSLAYVDTDDGRMIHERLAPLAAGTHGQPVLWWPWRATCTVGNGTLEPVHSPVPPSADD